MISKRNLFVGIIVLVGGAVVGRFSRSELSVWVIPIPLCLLSVFLIKNRPIKTGLITGLAIAFVTILASIFFDRFGKSIENFDDVVGTLMIAALIVLEGLIAGVIYKPRKKKTENVTTDSP